MAQQNKNKRNAGRKMKGDEPLDSVVACRLTADEKEALEAKAASKGFSKMTDFLRAVIGAIIKRQ